MKHEAAATAHAADTAADEAPIGLLQQIREDWQANRRDWTKPGFRALAVHRFGAWRMRIQTRALRIPFSVAYKAMFRYVRNHYGVELPDTVKVGRRVVIEHQGDIVVHPFAQIGDDTYLRQGVTIGNRHLDRPLEAPVLGKRVNIGAGAKILGGLRIGDDASIGANAVVLEDVPAGETVVGIPAKKLQRRH